MRSRRRSATCRRVGDDVQLVLVGQHLAQATRVPGSRSSPSSAASDSGLSKSTYCGLVPPARARRRCTVAKTRSGRPCARRQRCQAEEPLGVAGPGGPGGQRGGRAAPAARLSTRLPWRTRGRVVTPSPLRPGRHPAPHVQRGHRGGGEQQQRARHLGQRHRHQVAEVDRDDLPAEPPRAQPQPVGGRVVLDARGRPAAAGPRAAPSWPRPGRRSRSRSAGRAG